MNSHFRKIEDNRRLKKLCEETRGRQKAGAWFNDRKGRYIQYSHSDNSDSMKLCKRWSNRKVRRAKEALSRGLYKRLLDMWWMLD